MKLNAFRLTRATSWLHSKRQARRPLLMVHGSGSERVSWNDVGLFAVHSVISTVRRCLLARNFYCDTAFCPVGSPANTTGIPVLWTDRHEGSGIFGRWISLGTDWWACMYQFHDTRKHCLVLLRQMEVPHFTYLHELVTVFFCYWRFQHSSKFLKFLSLLSHHDNIFFKINKVNYIWIFWTWTTRSTNKRRKTAKHHYT